MRSTHFALSAPRATDENSAPKPALMLAVPKRLLKRAVDRNGLRRVARESWRAQAGSVDQTGFLLRLTRRPDTLFQMSRRQRKRFWRAELDVLLDRLAQNYRG